jgi:hypothetical protein
MGQVREPEVMGMFREAACGIRSNALSDMSPFLSESSTSPVMG